MLICTIRHVNGMLQLLDAEKRNPSITLGELQQRFANQYRIDPSGDEYFFYNQDQLLTSLSAYVCMPSETFYADLPEVPLSHLSHKWGTEGLAFTGSLKELVRFLRNSISHGNVSVNQELLFEFKNREQILVFNHLSLSRFCQALAYWCLTKDEELSGL